VAKPICLVRREGLVGPGIAAATALDGTQIVCTYAAAQRQQVLYAHYPLLTGAERDALEASLASGGARDVEGYSCVPAEKSSHRFEPIFGDYPESGPEHLKLWRATVKYYIVGG